MCHPRRRGRGRGPGGESARLETGAGESGEEEGGEQGIHPPQAGEAGHRPLLDPGAGHDADLVVGDVDDRGHREPAIAVAPGASAPDARGEETQDQGAEGPRQPPLQLRDVARLPGVEKLSRGCRFALVAFRSDLLRGEIIGQLLGAQGDRAALATQGVGLQVAKDHLVGPVLAARGPAGLPGGDDRVLVAAIDPQEHPLHAPAPGIQLVHQQHPIPLGALVELAGFQVGEVEGGFGPSLDPVPPIIGHGPPPDGEAGHEHRDDHKQQGQGALHSPLPVAAGRHRGHLVLGVQPPETDDHRHVEREGEEHLHRDDRLQEDQGRDGVGFQDAGGSTREELGGAHASEDDEEDHEDREQGSRDLPDQVAIENQHILPRTPLSPSCTGGARAEVRCAAGPGLGVASRSRV